MQTPVVKSTSVNLTLTDKVYKPLTINLPFQSLLIDLGLSYDSSVAPDIRMCRVINAGKSGPKDGAEVSANISRESGSDTAVRIMLQDGERLEEGEMYKLTITYHAKPLSENLPDVITRSCYIAVNYQLDSENLSIAALTDARKMVVCISDIHMGQDDYYAEIKQNRKPLIDFLDKLNASPNVSEMVIAGDLIDEWIIPASKPAEGDDFENCNCFSEKVKRNNEGVFDALNKICANDNIISTYVPGNHDLLMDEKQISAVLPGINQARDTKDNSTILGLGAYSPKDFPNAVIEHGHRYNFFCAPCLTSQTDPNEKSILPPGYFLTRIATEAFCYPALIHKHKLPKTKMQYGSEDIFMRSQYSAMCLSNLKMLPVRHTSSEKFIKADIDGLTGEYSIEDVMPHLEKDKLVSKLYKKISNKSNWIERQKANNVNVQISTNEAIVMSNSADETDSMSNIQYFSYEGSEKNIVVFGHSHVPRILTYPTTQGTTGIYANTGTWIDTNNLGATMTFVALIANNHIDSAPAFVNLYQYRPDGEIVLLDSQATYNFTDK